MKFTQKIGVILLAVFLILTGLAQIISLSFEGMRFVFGGLAIAAGICLLIDK